MKSKGLGNPLGSEKVCFEKKIDPVSRLREHLLGNCRAPHARRHGRAVRPQNPARYLPGGLQIKPDIYQAVLNCYVAVLKTPLLMVHPSLGSQDKYWDEPDNLDNNVNRR